MKWRLCKAGVILLALTLILSGCSGCRKKGGPKEASSPPLETIEEIPETLSPEKILGPMESIKDLDRQIESYKTGPSLTPQELEANRRLKQKIIRGTFDIYELCRLALDIHWEPMNENERKSFVDLLTNLLEKKAIFSKEQIKGGGDKPYRVTYKQEKYLSAEKMKSQVLTRIDVPSERIDLNVNYGLKLSSTGWKIYDVIVDEASLVENYKFQFDTIIRKHGRGELEARMRKKLKEMK